MANTASEKIKKYKESLNTEAEELILKEVPKTILKLNDILKSPQFRNREFVDDHQHLSIPSSSQDTNLTQTNKRSIDDVTPQDEGNVMLLPSGIVPSNRNLIELVEIIRPLLKKLIKDSNFIKTWITLLIPKVETGNNFGVSIQEDVLFAVVFVEAKAIACYNHITECFISRGNLICKMMKHPHIHDYRRALKEMDEHEYSKLCNETTKIRNLYCGLHDVLIKNLDKIKMPRSTDATEWLC